MSFRPLLSLRHSVATRLLSYVFSVYLLVSVIITIVHMVSEYRRVEENVIQDLIIFYRYANPTVAVALWEADREQIDSILNGFVKSPTITGIKISDLSGEFVRTNGKIIEDDNTRSFPRKTDSNILIKARDTELFGFQFPIIYAGEQGDHNIGSISLYSSPAVIFSRVKSSYIFIIVNAIIKTIVLWVIFLWFSRFLLRRPLAILTNAAEDIDMENLEKIRINTGSKYRDEIKILETAFNRMVEKLRDARDTNARIKEKQKSRLAKQVKKRTRELSDSEERYRRLVERAPFGIAIHQTGDIVFINGAGKKILGMPDVSTDGTAGEDRAYATGLLNQIIHKLNLVSADKDPLDHRIEEQFTRSDGSSVDLSVEGIEFSFKGIPAVQVVFQDITHRKIWEAGLREEKEQATRESLAKGRFLANMSHELRTPLNAVIGLTGVMKDNENLTVVQQRNISTIRRSGEHLLDLINNILDMSKIEAEKTAVFEDTVNLTGLLSDVHDLFRYQAFKKHVSLTIEHGDNLPPWIRTDKAKLRQILTNLIGNALKFTDSGSVTVRALPSKPAETADKKMMLRIEVEDTGPGISPDQVPYIFDPFVQVGSEKKQTQGTGLGLSISRRFARLLGGDLEMEEAADGGALFNLSLPVLVLESAPEKVMETSTAGMIANHFEDGRRDDIQEVTEGTIEDGTGKMPMSQIREEIGMLPGKLRGELQAAAIQVDYMYALKLVRDMTDLNPALADTLSDLIHNFKFDTLQTLCEKAD